MLVTKSIEIDMGHRVPNHKSKCRNLHGHRYKIEVGVDDKVVTLPGESDEGMVIDFSDLKELMIEVLDKQFDHGFVLYDKDIITNIFRTFSAGGEVLHKLMNSAALMFNRPYEEPEYQIGMKMAFVQFIPTAENLAEWWYSLLKQALALKQIKIHHVTVWETPTSSATFEE